MFYDNNSKLNKLFKYIDILLKIIKIMVYVLHFKSFCRKRQHR